MAGEHGLWYKNTFYEGGVGIPHIWSFPKALPQSRTIAAPVMNMDVFPTLCDLCNLPKPAGLEGGSLMPLMKGQEEGSQRIAFSENYRNGIPARMIRTQRWKYCYFHKDREQLFDLQNDPGEETNLAKEPQHRDLVASLKAQALKGWHPDDYFKHKKAAKQAGKQKVE